MEGYLTNISEEVQNHLKQLASSVELPEGEDALNERDGLKKKSYLCPK